jgi:drug/metabolite transporter (DMT)-like permease
MSARAWLAFWALGIIWGVPYFFIRIAVQELSPFVVAWGRLTLAAFILLPIAWRRGALRSVGPYMAAIFAFSLVEFVIPFTAIAFGERWISSAVAGILIAGVPLTVVFISRFFGVEESLGSRRVVGLVLGLCGVAALLGLGSVSGLTGWVGVGCMLLATVGYAVGPLIIQRHLHGLDSLGPLSASLGLSSLVLLIPALATLPHQWPSSAALMSVAVLGVLCSAVAMLLMFYLVRSAGASRATTITYVNPIVASFLGVGVLHETLGKSGWIALGVILLGVFLANKPVR